MADSLGGIYYKHHSSFGFDRACDFLAKENIFLFNKPQNGVIIALNSVGDDCRISYEQAKREALSGNLFNLKIWLNHKWRFTWTFRSDNDCSIVEFDLWCLFDEEAKKVSKAFTKFFLSEINSQPQSMLGMYIDKNGETYDYVFDPVFLTEEEEVDYVTDLICLPEEKFNSLVVMEAGFARRELDNGFVCASRYPEFINYLLN